MNAIEESKEMRALTEQELSEVTGGFDIITILGHTITLGDVKDAVVAVAKVLDLTGRIEILDPGEF